MKKSYVIVLILIYTIGISSTGMSEEPKYQSQAVPKVLNYFIELESEWIGTHINHQGEEEQVELVYRTVSGGTAVEERIFADTPKEMITVYHGSGENGILMTHYCMLGNQPRLQLEKSHEIAFNFKYLDGVGIDREKTRHMGGMKLTILDENTIQQEWDYYEDGEIKNTSTLTFTRK